MAGALALATGVISALQSRANGSLGVLLQQSLVAAAWSFVSGWVALSLIALARPQMRRGVLAAHRAYRAGRLPWWQFFGGLLGGAYVGTQAFSVPVVGVALFSIASLGGQTVNALAVDRWGLGPAGAKPISRLRLAAAALAVVGIIIAVGPRVGALTEGFVLACVLAFAPGAGLSLQAAINGQVRTASGDAMTAAWINFSWGSVLLGGLVLGRLAAGALTWSWPTSLPVWALLGGLLGVTNVALSTILVHRLGVLVLMLLGLAGQLVGALTIDLLVSDTRGFVGPQLLLGIVVTMVAAGAAAVAARRDAARAGAVEG